jgi:GTP-binding protein
VLVHLLEVSTTPGRTPLRDYAALRKELALYDEQLAGRPEIVVLNKIDLPEARRRLPALRRALARKGLALYGVSAATGKGVPELLEAAWAALHGPPLSAPADEPRRSPPPARRSRSSARRPSR